MANNKLQLITSVVIALLMFSYSPTSVAKEWVPEKSSDVILIYDIKDFHQTKRSDGNKIHTSEQDFSTILLTISEYIDNSKYPGNSHKLITAKNLIESIKINKLNNTQVDQYYLIKANIAQSEHNFDQAVSFLDKINDYSVYYPQSLLVAARIYIIQNKLDNARVQCRNLLSHNMAASELCLIEVKIHQGEVDSIRPSITRLSQRYTSSNTPLTRFYHQVTGSMHRLEGNYSEAQSMFSYKLNKAPVSQLYQWADMAFENRSHKIIYKKLYKLAQENRVSLEDGILVRLARAEKLTTKGDYFQSLAKKKVQLRILRNDQLHAADIAYYYTYISPNAQLAKKWALQNWNNVKELADKELLEQAQKLEN